MSSHVHFDHGSWEFQASLTLTLLLSASLYLRVWIPTRSSSAAAIPAWKAGSFLLGLVLVWMAWVSPLAAYDHSLLTFHMIKHLLLMTFAPPLILLNRPRVAPTTRPATRTNRHKSCAVLDRLRADSYCLARTHVNCARRPVCDLAHARTSNVFWRRALVLVACYRALAKHLNWPAMVAALVPFSGDSALRHPFWISRLL